MMGKEKRNYSIAPHIPPDRARSHGKWTKDDRNGKWEMGNGKWEIGDGDMHENLRKAMNNYKTNLQKIYENLRKSKKAYGDV